MEGGEEGNQLTFPDVCPGPSVAPHLWLKDREWRRGDLERNEMKTYTISAKERNARNTIPLRRAKETRDNVLLAVHNFSRRATLCDVVITQGSKHVVTYRDGNVTHLNGEEHKG